MAALTGLFFRCYINNLSQLIYIYGIFVVIIAFYGLVLVPAGAMHPLVAPAIIWINLLVCTLLFSNNLFQAEAEEGALEQWLLMPVTLEWVVASKWLAYWCVVTLPILLLIPLAGVFLQLEPSLWLALLGCVLLGSVAVTAVACFGASAMLTDPRRAALMMLLVLPLLLPVILFGVGGIVDPARLQMSWLMLVGLSAVALPVSIVSSAAMIRASLS